MLTTIIFLVGLVGSVAFSNAEEIAEPGANLSAPSDERMLHLREGYKIRNGNIYFCEKKGDKNIYATFNDPYRDVLIVQAGRGVPVNRKNPKIQIAGDCRLQGPGSYVDAVVKRKGDDLILEITKLYKEHGTPR